GIYFLLLYPKKLRLVKISAVVILFTITAIVFYTNTQTHFPAFLEKNHTFKVIQPRLSVAAFLNDGRFPAWQVGFKAFLQKPWLGWGPENYSIGFDKYYNNFSGDAWWDRAHNIPLEIATTAGLPALVL